MATTGIVIPCYNRPHYLKKCLTSLEDSHILAHTAIYIIDDCSTNEHTKELIKNFKCSGVEVIKKYNTENKGVADCLKQGFDYFYENDYEILCNLDADAIVNAWWQFRLNELYLKHKGNILSGFNAGNSAYYDKGKDKKTHYEKDRVLGLNLYFNSGMYKYIKEALEKEEFWDVELTQIIRDNKKKIYCN